MNLQRSPLLFAALVVTATATFVVLVVAIVPLVLDAVADLVWAFVMTPGGIVALVLVWKWLSIQEARARSRKKS